MFRLKCLMFTLFHLLCIWTGYCTADPIVQTKYGAVKGFKFERTSDTGISDVFLGIPFAKPPLGDLRFEKPVPPNPWPEMLQATNYGASCPPHNRTVPVPPSSEDCLTLNVMRPSNTSSSSRLPVLVWIHGGGYSIGSASLYPYTGLANIYNAQDIIVVSSQYRLGFLGFFSDGDSMPGNLGLWDQVQALRFIQEIIGDFGGDKDRVTIWGLSAGGASTSQLVLSPHVSDLYQQSISMSGSAFANWAFAEKTVQHSMELAEAVGCTRGEQLKKCLKEKTVSELHDAVDKIGSAYYSINLLKWNPRIDGDLFLETPEEMIKSAPKRPSIIGVSLKESLFFSVLGWTKSIHRLEVLPLDFERYDRQRLQKAIQDLVTTNEYYGADQLSAVFDAVVEEYVEAEGKENRGFFLEMYNKILSDTMFNVAAAREAVARSSLGMPTYLYLTEHFNKALYPEHYPVKGATHVCEYPYVLEMFTLGKFDIQGDDVERRVAATFRESFGSFIKTGVPVNSMSMWPSTSTSSPLQYLRITDHPHVEQGFFERELNFWNRLAEKTGFDLISFRRTGNVSKPGYNDEL